MAAVSNAEGAAANVRNFIEHNTLRKILSEIGDIKSGQPMCDVGCWYGRLTILLQGFVDTVVGFECEGGLLGLARPLALLSNTEKLTISGKLRTARHLTYHGIDGTSACNR